MGDEYDVKEYTDEQLFRIMDLNNPSDRELEAKILSMVRKYSNFGNPSGNKLSQFFIDIYNRFFETDDNTEEIEGFQTYNGDVPTTNIFSKAELSQKDKGVTGTVNLGNVVKPAADNLQLTRPLDYSKDQLNPLLKQTIKRIISIDSQYRNNQTNTPSTNFTFNLSEPLRDVVSLSLYSIQIPYTWYTVNSDFGGNFFYLKGTSPGINTGLHDYKIAIPSGNYTPSGLGNALNKSISELAAIYTDVSFGTTEVIYNDRRNDPGSGTGKCDIQIDITKVYNEGNYSLEFPTWSSPLLLLEGSTNPNPAKLQTIAGYMGFNNQSYYCSSIYSAFFINRNTDHSLSSTSNTSFKIVPYTGNSYKTADVLYTPIIVNLTGLPTVPSIPDLVAALNNSLTGVTFTKSYNVNGVASVNELKVFDDQFTKCVIHDVSNNLKASNGFSYVEFSCKLNNMYAPVVPNLKLAAVFQSDASNSIFYGNNSFFKFSERIKDGSGNIICEFNELLSESPILQTDYDASNASIQYISTTSGYDASFNNLIIPIPPRIYTLDSLITATNSAIKTAISLNPRFSDTNILFYSDASSYLNFKTAISNTYTNADYKIYATGDELNNMFNITARTDASSVEASLRYNNPNYKFNAISFDASDVIYITPKGGIGLINTNATFVISFQINRIFGNGNELASYLTGVFQRYTYPNTTLYPLSRSNVTYSITDGFTLNLFIFFNIDSSSYKLNFIANVTDSSTNVWSKLQFNSSYSLTPDASKNYIVTSSNPVKTNQILIDGSNDIFYFTPSNLVNVFSTSGTKYKISIKIPHNSYSIKDLNNEINSQLASFGTIFDNYISPDGISYTKIRFNINRVFTTKDYKLVFYDPYSFTSCISKNSKSASNTSIQNATWDTTLGWMLGFRNEISYTLSDYVTSTSNICFLRGDTSVSTNLYNYFLIMLDDYVQNHLNDGLVTITNQETNIDPGPYINICDPVDGTNIAVPADYGSPGVTYTAQQLYAFNQQVQSQIIKTKSYSSGPFVQDIFGIIPVKTSGMAIGSVYVEFGGSLQNQQRLYFGPVNIHRMTIKLLNDRGNLVDLNNANWSFSFICEQLYKSGIS